MELDDMKHAWAELALRQDGIEQLLKADQRDRGMDRARTTLRWSLAGAGIELLAWIVGTALAASFWVHERHTTHWLLMGLLLHAYGIAGIWACATDLLLLTRIYLFDAPVLVLQRRLAQLRRFRVVSTLALGLPWWLLWVLATFVLARALTGADLYLAAPGWFWISLAFGAVAVGASVWLARRVAATPQRAPFWQRIIDDLSGRNLKRAAREMDALARFGAD
ncbi:MAG TPA: hypothetical protein VFN09_04650 [Rhodanobacteraceae bacterium]|nr:hypothetical protein [Rhodanobacteraceae bacterium]